MNTRIDRETLAARGLRRLGLSRVPKYGDAFYLIRKACTINDPIIFDVGTHKGETAKIFKELFRDCKIHCFEPNLFAFRELTSTFLNDPSVSLNNYALASDSGTALFYANSFSATSSIFPVTENVENLVWDKSLLSLESTYEIRKRSLDSYVRENSIKEIDILKIDVQGAEFLVLQGAIDQLRSQTIKLIYFEYLNTETYKGQTELVEYIKLLKSFDYELFGIFSPCYRKNRLAQFDLMFVPISGK